MSQIRVLQVLTSMNRGGAETMIMNYYRNIDRTQVQFDFLLHRSEEGAFDKEILAMGGKIFHMPPIHPKNYFGYKKKLKSFFTAHKEYTIVHSHLNALSFMVLSAAKENGVNTRIAHSHIAIESISISDFFDKNSENKTLVKDLIFSMLKHKVAKQATHFFACGIKAGDWLFGKENKSRYKVVNNAIDTSKFKRSEIESQAFRQTEGLVGKKIIGHIGRFDNQKNHLFLIDIFSELSKLNDDVVLCLVGQGDLEEKIREKVSGLSLTDKVHFLGVRSDIPRVINAFDLFLFPSFYEGLPLTLIEAQTAGIPIVASDTISREVEVTDLITFLSLEKSAVEWAKITDEALINLKRDTILEIKKAGYDIVENARGLQDFYLNVN